MKATANLRQQPQQPQLVVILLLPLKLLLLVLVLVMVLVLVPTHLILIATTTTSTTTTPNTISTTAPTTTGTANATAARQFTTTIHSTRTTNKRYSECWNQFTNYYFSFVFPGLCFVWLLYCLIGRVGGMSNQRQSFSNRFEELGRHRSFDQMTTNDLSGLLIDD